MWDLDSIDRKVYAFSVSKGWSITNPISQELPFQQGRWRQTNTPVDSEASLRLEPFATANGWNNLCNGIVGHLSYIMNMSQFRSHYLVISHDLWIISWAIHWHWLELAYHVMMCNRPFSLCRAHSWQGYMTGTFQTKLCPRFPKTSSTVRTGSETCSAKVVTYQQEAPASLPENSQQLLDMSGYHRGWGQSS